MQIIDYIVCVTKEKEMEGVLVHVPSMQSDHLLKHFIVLTRHFSSDTILILPIDLMSQVTVFERYLRPNNLLIGVKFDIIHYK